MPCEPTPADLKLWPELALPFVKLRNPRPLDGKPVDYWAPPRIKGENGLEASFRGGHYARLAIEHMARDKKRQPILLEIIACMVEKGRFWAKFSGDKQIHDSDDVATGFVYAVANILCWADAAGVTRQQAVGEAVHLERAIAEGLSPRCARKSARRAIGDLHAFARGHAHV